jgi:hypothetical protein
MNGHIDTTLAPIETKFESPEVCQDLGLIREYVLRVFIQEFRNGLVNEDVSTWNGAI